MKSVHPIIQKIAANQREVAKLEKEIPKLVEEANSILPNSMSLTLTEKGEAEDVDGTELKLVSRRVASVDDIGKYGGIAKCLSHSEAYYEFGEYYHLVKTTAMGDDDILVVDEDCDVNSSNEVFDTYKFEIYTFDLK